MVGKINEGPDYSRATDTISEQADNREAKPARSETTKDDSLIASKLDKEFLKKLCSALQQDETRLSFFLHPPSQRLGVRLLDARTMEVIKELPPEQQLELVARIKDMVGLILDQEA